MRGRRGACCLRSRRSGDVGVPLLRARSPPGSPFGHPAGDLVRINGVVACRRSFRAQRAGAGTAAHRLTETRKKVETLDSVHADPHWGLPPDHGPNGGLCFAPRSVFPAPTGIDPTLVEDSVRDIASLPEHISIALATLLRFLLCGEESATHAFGDSLPHSLADTERSSLEVIAREEAAHAWLIGQWTTRLPDTPVAFDVVATRHFFRRLQTRDRALHFARVAALDALVCRLLSRLIRGAALAPYAGLRAGLSRIRSDEIEHVRISRAHAMHQGMGPAGFSAVAVDVGARLDVLLAPAMPALRVLTGSDRPIRPRVCASAPAEDRRLAATPG